MEINIPTGKDILRDIAIQYVNKAFVYITDCNPFLTECHKEVPSVYNGPLCGERAKSCFFLSCNVFWPIGKLFHHSLKSAILHAHQQFDMPIGNLTSF